MTDRPAGPPAPTPRAGNATAYDRPGGGGSGSRTTFFLVLLIAGVVATLLCVYFLRGMFRG